MRARRLCSSLFFRCDEEAERTTDSAHQRAHASFDLPRDESRKDAQRAHHWPRRGRPRLYGRQGRGIRILRIEVRFVVQPKISNMETPAVGEGQAVVSPLTERQAEMPDSHPGVPRMRQAMRGNAKDTTRWLTAQSSCNLGPRRGLKVHRYFSSFSSVITSNSEGFWPVCRDGAPVLPEPAHQAAGPLVEGVPKISAPRAVGDSPATAR